MTLRVTFLGTGGAVPTTERNVPGVFVNREGDGLLFDCGEGTQRQMMRFNTGFDVAHVFVSHLHGDHVLGLPGLLQTLDFNDREEPIAVHGPPGSRGHLRSLVTAVGHETEFPVRVSEVAPGEVALDADGYEVRAVETEHRATSVGYALIEDERKGRFDRERAEELGVPPGPLFSRLHDGHTVELEDGTVVEPEEVVGTPRPGRRLVYTGDTRPVDAVVAAAERADLLIHDATFAEDERGRARSTGHSTAREAGEVARRADAERLALVHVSSRYAGDATPLEREARAAFGDGARVPDDGDDVEVPFPED
jgi:ribonuclease Z